MPPVFVNTIFSTRSPPRGAIKIESKPGYPVATMIEMVAPPSTAEQAMMIHT
jgi:hypothetical protein